MCLYVNYKSLLKKDYTYNAYCVSNYDNSFILFDFIIYNEIQQFIANDN